MNLLIKLLLMNKVNKFSKIILLLLTLVGITCLALFSYYLAVNKNVTLNESKLNSSAIKFELISDTGAVFYSESNLSAADYIAIDNLNDYTLNAFISIEDRRFYSHKGIDYRRIAGALLNNVKSLSLKEGASTISQQLIKNTHLTNEKTLKRKFNEIKLTLELERKYSKKEILEKYLNTIYFGGGAYGINSASKRYFNKNASELTINESCMLAGIIKAPTIYSPITNYDNSIKRKNLVLKAMFDCNYISKSEYQKLKNESIEISNTKSENYLDDYVSAVKSEYENMNIFNPYCKDKLVKIYTYLDENVQKNITETKIDTDLNFSKQQVVINNKNSGIIAFYGNNSNLKRSPASCIKPWYVYAPMINDNIISESTVIIDEQTNFDGYKPKNFGNKYYGAVTVKTALTKSLNVASVKLLASYGFEKANAYAKKLNLDIQGDNLTVALGVTKNGLTLSQLADCYTVFANNGNYNQSSFIKEIKINDVSVYKKTNKSNQVFSSSTAFIINDILKETVNSGTAKKLSGKSFDIAAKTGTNGTEDGNTDAYTVCYTKEHTVAVWLGNEDYSLLNNKISGGTYPAIYSNACIDFLYKNYAPPSFTVPDDIVSADIDVDYLLKEQIPKLTNDKTNTEKFYYIKGTEPTEYLNENRIISISISNISVENKSVSIDFENINCEKVEIKRKHSGKSTTVYNGPPNNFCDYNLLSGIYVYEIIPYNDINGKIEKGKSIITPSIKIQDKQDEILNDEWWTE